MNVPQGAESFNTLRGGARYGLELVEHVEGRTRLVVPRASVTSVPPPTSPVFFNPAASLNRDVTVAVTAGAGGGTFCDAMAGVGARGIRVAKEVERVPEVVLVDFNEGALRLAKRSAALNRVAGKCSFRVSETAAYLHSRFGRDQRFDFVDLDPFGTPVRQLLGGLSATAEGGVLSVTATDTAVLCGVQRPACVRRYGATPLNNHFRHETGIRILLAALARTGASVDIGVEPLLAQSTRHYVRVFVRVVPGASAADASLEGVGVVSWCPGCGDAAEGESGGRCRVCGGRTRVAGPLWRGGVVDESLVDASRRAATRAGLARAAEALASLAGTDGFPPWSFDIDLACSELKVPTPSELAVRTSLTRRGHRAMRTPFERAGVKTDASYREFLEAVREARSGRAAGDPPASPPRSSSTARSSRSGSRQA
jgi:tRNA (guanine26-N2/guanine27-N2)-dimethyltransferase